MGRHVLQDHPYFIACNYVVIVVIVAAEGYVHLLFLRAHQKFQEELDEFIMVNSGITICIDLTYNALAQQLR